MSVSNDILREAPKGKDPKEETWLEPNKEWVQATALKNTGEAIQKIQGQERKNGRVDDLFCSACFSLERNAGLESQDFEDYNVLKFQKIKPVYSTNKTTQESVLLGYSLDYKCSERGHGHSLMFNKKEAKEFFNRVTDKKIKELYESLSKREE